MTRPEAELPLDEGALLIAAMADVTVDVSVQLARLDDVAAQIGSADTGEVCRFVFETLGVRGDLQTYDDPRNSYLDQVLDRRLGIPISISVLLMEIGRRCGVRSRASGCRGTFCCGTPVSRTSSSMRSPAAGASITPPAPSSCAPWPGRRCNCSRPIWRRSGPASILARMLANLDQSFRRRDDKEGGRWVTRLRAAIPGQPLTEQIALADTFARLGCVDEAATLFEELARRPETPVDMARSLQARARGLLAPYN